MEDQGAKPTFPSLERLLLRAGTLAGAVISIAAAVALLWPDGSTTPVPSRIAAVFAQMDIEREVPLSEFESRHGLTATLPTRPVATLEDVPSGADAPTEGPGGPSRDTLSPDGPDDDTTDTAPDAPDDGTVQPDEALPPGNDLLVEGTPTEEELEADKAALGIAGEELAQEETGAVTVLRRRLPPAALPPGCRYATVEGRLAIRCPGETPLTALTENLPDDYGDPLPPHRWMGAAAQRPTRLEPPVVPAAALRPVAGDVADDVVPANAVAHVVQDIRADSIRKNSTGSAATTTGESQPLGVSVSFTANLIGLAGRDVDFYWSLYNPLHKAEVLPDWLRDRRVLSTQVEAESDHYSGEFWVPLPIPPGPFFVRVSAYVDGKKLRYRDTERFR